MGGARIYLHLSPAGAATTWGMDDNGDGLPDDWQTEFWGSNTTKWAAMNVDSDGDGASNFDEFLAGTDPRNANSALRGQVAASANGQLFFNWMATTGLVYQIQHSTDLVNWSDYGPPRLAAEAADSVTIERTGVAGYYRLIILR
jgi:hypothetical protein